MKTVIVTGGCGFIGSHFIEILLEKGYRVINIDALTYAGDPINTQSFADKDNYAFLHADIGDSALIADALSKFHPQMVFNLAAESHVDRSIDNATPFLTTNVIAVHSLLDTCLAYWRKLADSAKTEFLFVQMSTDEVYGSISEGVFTEESNYAPNSPYAASKAAGDHLTRSYRVTYGLPTAIVHASNTYGPRQFPEKLIPHMIASALAGKQLPVYGAGDQVRDWMYVGDVAQGLEHVVAQGKVGGIYNFAGGQERRNIDTVKSICAILDKLVPKQVSYAESVTHVADRPGHDARYAMSSENVEHLFGWKPETTFEEGLAKTVRWYLENGSWMDYIRNRGYSIQRIGGANT
ncbi:dTDP-glucose 4,6-dehydratase [Rhizobium leguminosarum]|uniref:dTDP-glucose 4,6-dehydratase n=1 Tax=Rhizobium leguminosarum TaxID=384 RepID=UPI001C94C6FE|nr:dTDP-glucose 4,6-dehydratase [Rhizobium leguminosarum]MBY5559234.1 dTDP-glucose 4,6-dehydratase [Rhizobium leguminosarum]MBY5708367.1 dTDP-glucose 4,6-dehydratase [Rhizobium leguminosarum]